MLLTIATFRKEQNMKNTINRILNFALYISFCLMTGTGLLLSFRLPPGSKGGRGLTMLGMDRHEWGTVHLWISYGFILFILLHLYIHRAWLIKIASRNHAWRMWFGLLLGLLAIAFLMLYPIEAQLRK